MTERLNALTVVLSQDIREDDAQAIIDAIKMIRGVASVEGNVVDINSHIAYTRARNDLTQKLFDALQ